MLAPWQTPASPSSPGANRGIGRGGCAPARGARPPRGPPPAGLPAGGFATLDVEDRASIDAFAGAQAKAGVDVLVNNAGASFDGFDASVAARTLAVNFFGAMHLTDALLPSMRPGGRVVMVSSGMGKLSNLGPALRARFEDPSLTRAGLLELLDSFVRDVGAGVHGRHGWPSNAYSVSKIGMNALVRVMARELEGDPRGILVNSADPGWVRTRMGGRSAPLRSKTARRPPSTSRSFRRRPDRRLLRARAQNRLLRNTTRRSPVVPPASGRREGRVLEPHEQLELGQANPGDRSVLRARCCVVFGGGPAGVMLGLLAGARGGRRHRSRKTRGLFSGIFAATPFIRPRSQVMHELGVLARRLTGSTFTRRSGELLRVRSARTLLADRGLSHTFRPSAPRFVALMPRWDFLNFLVEKAKVYPTFRLHMEAEVTDLLREDDRIVGVRAKGPGGAFEVRANLTVGADGRRSTVRAHAHLPLIELGSPMDVPVDADEPRTDNPTLTFGHVEPGRILVMLDRSDYWQCAYVIAKGEAAAMRQKDISQFRDEIVKLSRIFTIASESSGPGTTCTS